MKMIQTFLVRYGWGSWDPSPRATTVPVTGQCIQINNASAGALQFGKFLCKTAMSHDQVIGFMENMDMVNFPFSV